MKRNPALNLILALLTFAVIFAGLTWVYYRFSVDNPGGGDFLPRWAGARAFLVEGQNPYSEEVSQDIQNLFYGRLAREGEDQQFFVYPFFSILFFGPFALIENYELARALWMTVLTLCLGWLAFSSADVVDWKNRPLKTVFLAVFAVFWYFGVRNIINGQFAVLNTVLIILAFQFIKKKEDVPAGFLLALSTIKPQMVFLLIPLILIWAYSKKRYGLIYGTLGTLAILIALSTLLLPTWIRDNLIQIVAYPNYTDIGSPVSVIAGWLPGIEKLLSSTLHIVLYLYLLVEWFLVWKKDERWLLWTALMTLTITNLVALRTATTHFVVLLPALFLVFRVTEGRWKKLGQVVSALLLLILLAGGWGLFLLTVDGNTENAIMYVPLPVFCLFALWWVRWWALRPPKLMLEEYAARPG